VTEAGASSPYAVPLDDLVRAARVPFDEQTTEQPTGQVPASDPDEERRQLRLAGGA
jgi:hypothetical protein